MIVDLSSVPDHETVRFATYRKYYIILTTGKHGTVFSLRIRCGDVRVLSNEHNYTVTFCTAHVPYDMQICTNVGRSWRKLCTVTGQSEIHRYIFTETRENKSISARVYFYILLSFSPRTYTTLRGGFPVNYIFPLASHAAIHRKFNYTSIIWNYIYM